MLVLGHDWKGSQVQIGKNTYNISDTSRKRIGSHDDQELTRRFRSTLETLNQSVKEEEEGDWKNRLAIGY